MERICAMPSLPSNLTYKKQLSTKYTNKIIEICNNTA
jgi:hypothetical protein